MNYQTDTNKVDCDVTHYYYKGMYLVTLMIGSDFMPNRNGIYAFPQAWATVNDFGNLVMTETFV